MNTALSSLLTLCIGATVLSYIITGVVAKSGFLSDPVSARSNHTVPTSRAGGLVVLFVAITLCGVAWSAGAPLPPPVAVMALCAGALGALDDATPLAPTLKLGVLLALSILTTLVSGVVLAVPIPFVGMVALPALVAWPLAVFFVLGFVNAFNFMDGLNGMAGGIGMAGIGLIVATGAAGSVGLVIVALILAAVLFGFTIRNVMKGSIFLGDAGSLSVGLFLAASALWSSQADASYFYIFAIGMLPLIIDTAFTLLRRAREGKSVLDAHKEHLYQRLREQGWSHQAVSAAYTALTILCGTLALSLGRSPTGLWLAGVLGIAAYSAAIFWMFRFRSGGSPN
ncbi:hypothetical protein [Parvularcula sp. LCG005]|uniref:glycosyltransferase family 4 protein n=1 Tax=Parvularcula sp. LCG005 TaxID=3078805 RepID=UPI002943B44F|nr:hypothetical protein [Parvularcula sp. LCG005]WOI52103.1 hypothetical protein RUI03_08025 [Parvularcula sp. LCG005]